MKRRTFIQTSSIMTLPVVLGGVEVTAIKKSRLTELIQGDSDKVLVLIQLNGGNDGLNTFIPIDQNDQLANLRPQIFIPENKTLKITDKNAFHPAMTGFRNMFNEGLITPIQSVGYPDQNRSHFRSTDIWVTATDSDQFVSTGWLGRYFDLNYQGFPEQYPNDAYKDPFAITLGSIVSETCQGPVASFSYAVESKDGVLSLDDTISGTTENNGCYGGQLSFVKDVVRQTNVYSGQVLDAFDKGNNLVSYPDSRLAENLKIVANLISGGLGTKVYVVSLGGFDTHAGQADGTDTAIGDHATLLGTLADAIQAFQKDLVALGIDKRVLGMTFSEFGRQIRGNGSFGTDHGNAAPLFIFGSCVSGSIIGSNPQIDPQTQVQEGVALQYDFRSVYATILMDWFGADSSAIENILFKDFTRLPFIAGCQTTSSETPEITLKATLQPNPAITQSRLTMESSGDAVNIVIYDVRGSSIKTICNKRLGKGTHEINVDVSDLSAGVYILHIREGIRQENLRMIKI